MKCKFRLISGLFKIIQEELSLSPIMHIFISVEEWTLCRSRIMKMQLKIWIRLLS